MKKFIGLLTTMLMTVFVLSCGIFPAAIAADAEEIASGKELIAGNIKDLEFEQFTIKLEGDSIKFITNSVEYHSDGCGYNASEFSMDVATNDKVTIRSYTDTCCFTPESNGKYIVVVNEYFTDYYTTFVSLVFKYFIPVICHDNIVDIDTDNIYVLCNTDSDSYIVKTSDRIYKRQSGTYPIAIVLPKDKAIYSLKSFDANIFDIDKAMYLLLSCFFEDHFFLDNRELILLSRDKQSEFYANFDIDSTTMLDGDLSRRFGSFRAAFQRDLSPAGIDSVNGMKPASKIFFVHPSYIIENTVFLNDSSGITKFCFDVSKTKYKDLDGMEYETINLLPEKFISAKIPDNDVNLDGEFGVADVVILQEWLLGKSEMNEINAILADVCKDGILDVFDLCVMRKKLIE